jgi:hypothetical protein
MKILAFLLCLFAATSAFAQAQGQQQGYPVTLTGTRYDAAQGGQSTTPAINAQTTLTIPAGPSGAFTYLTYWSGAACLDGTASASNIQANWTSTNMPALTAQTSVISGSTITTNAGVPLCDRFYYSFTTPYKSSCAACVVTLVSPAASTHVSYPQLVTYYYAP